MWHERTESSCVLKLWLYLGLQRAHLRGHGLVSSRVDTAASARPRSSLLRFPGAQTGPRRPDQLSGSRCQSHPGGRQRQLAVGSPKTGLFWLTKSSALAFSVRTQIDPE